MLNLDDISINELEEIVNEWKKSCISIESGKIEVRKLSETGIIMGVLLPAIVDYLRSKKNKNTDNK